MAFASPTASSAFHRTMSTRPESLPLIVKYRLLNTPRLKNRFPPWRGPPNQPPDAIPEIFFFEWRRFQKKRFFSRFPQNKIFKTHQRMSDTNNSTHSEFPKGFDALPRPFVVVFGNQKYHSMVVRWFLIFFRRATTRLFFFFRRATTRLSFFRRSTTQLHIDDPTPHLSIQVRTLIACQTEDTNLNSHDMCKIESVPDTFTIPRKNAAYLKRKEEGRQKMFAGVHPDGVFKSGWCWKWLSGYHVALNLWITRTAIGNDVVFKRISIISRFHVSIISLKLHEHHTYRHHVIRKSYKYQYRIQTWLWRKLKHQRLTQVQWRKRRRCFLPRSICWKTDCTHEIELRTWFHFHCCRWLQWVTHEWSCK